MSSERIRAPYKNYEVNQKLIMEALEKCVEENDNDLPTFERLAEITGLSSRTISRHYSSLDFSYIVERERIHSPSVIKAIRDSAIEGKALAQKLYAQIVEKIILKTSEERKVIGDLNVNAVHSGTLKVEVVRMLVTSRADLDRIKEGVKLGKAVVADDEAPGPLAGADKKPEDIVEIPTVEVPIIGTATALLLGKTNE